MPFFGKSEDPFPEYPEASRYGRRVISRVHSIPENSNRETMPFLPTSYTFLQFSGEFNQFFSDMLGKSIGPGRSPKIPGPDTL